MGYQLQYGLCDNGQQSMAWACFLSGEPIVPQRPNGPQQAMTGLIQSHANSKEDPPLLSFPRPQ